ncbi:hypothetical protein FHS19_002985 [Paenibacillus rhizosphaerae]|uniref:Uncharacterized protein n=1 Tax=Paenibacillus rhizosphaerae TaxID=297318 RepID=A0A839TP19_9BACL|nr:hypothetical protein [Paenibacillus rhizosphaerae]
MKKEPLSRDSGSFFTYLMNLSMYYNVTDHLDYNK